MEVTVTEDMICELIEKYYKSIEHKNGLEHFKKTIEYAKDKMLFVDNVLEPMVILDKDEYHHSEIQIPKEGKVKTISINGKLILPFTLYCTHQKEE